MSNPDRASKIPPSLTPATVVCLSREGGVAHFPGLAKPRRIVCARLDDAQREDLQRLLATAQQHQEPISSESADRRVIKVLIELKDSGETVWSLQLAEDQAPQELLELWKQIGSNDT
ncbi:protealysin inhibitor emfourin [Pistricoccus aurantiacus]|uniref:protealysin inhibitor emfourin n=1 Tax=Pistricoccus aurantiacus TaxID=1883414 RepID=UPI00363A0BC2